MFSYSSLFPQFPSLQPLLPNRRHSAVAIAIDPKGYVLMIQRAKHKGDPWSGHMAFPGGKYEPEDDSLWETALRECKEELGFALKDFGDPLGALTRIHHPKIYVDALVFLLSKKPNPNPNKEVSGYFWVSLADLQNPSFRTEREYLIGTQKRAMPAIVLPDLPVPIWGFSLTLSTIYCLEVFHDLLVLQLSSCARAMFYPCSLCSGAVSKELSSSASKWREAGA